MTRTTVVASQNPVKLEAVRVGFARLFPGETFAIEGVGVPSGVSDQPMSDAETLQGAHNRALNAKEQTPQADFWVGVEGGSEDSGSEMSAFAWVVILAQDTDVIGKARTATFFLPQEVAALVRQGKELGEADDIVFQRSNSKQANGSIGLLTGDAITRTDLYAPAVTMALIPFTNPGLTFSDSHNEHSGGVHT
jgi:inosine/xanthosine triphosphatase